MVSSTSPCRRSAAGVDGAMLSEHVVLGRDAGAAGPMANPRDYAAPGNQDPPSTAWPSSIVLLSAIAQATSSLRLVAGAIIAPLRHPLLLAKELGTLDLLSGGRLVVLPTVSWSRHEYDALGVPFAERGRILDEQLEVLQKSWGPYPISHEGRASRSTTCGSSPAQPRPTGPPLWFGGQGMHPPLVRRLARYGSGLNPFGPLSHDDLEPLAEGDARARPRLSESSRWSAGSAVRFQGPDDVADLDAGLGRRCPVSSPRASRTICFKPAMFVDSADQVGDLCHELTAKVERIAGAL